MPGYDEISRCNRCGFCQSVCPTYLHSRDETQVARGRIYLTRLLLEGKYDFTLDSEVSGKVDDCLLCGACTVNCPASVKTDEIMVSARRDFAANRGLTLFQKLVYRGLLSHNERLELASLLMRIYERTGARNVLYGKILGRALDRLAYYDSFLPRGMSRPARAQLEPVMAPSGSPRLRVGYFLGCASNVFWSQTALTAISYLIHRGVEVHLPPTGCCGEPHRTCGDEAEVRRLAAINSTLIFREGFDLRASDGSTCAQALAHYDEFVGADSREAERVRPLLGKVVDLNTLVVEHL
ncbi:MAG: (Fe-S)-binding protein, partial [Deltaproteobacteria bacterium]|nr:(Fe-S)-binding protein [Deltaproteobacteria bacterium]